MNYGTTAWFNPKKLSLFCLVVGLRLALPAGAETVENLDKTFAVTPGGTVLVEVDFGTLDVSTNANKEVSVQVWRKVSRRDKAAEEEFLRERPVTISQEGNTITVRARAEGKSNISWNGWQRNEARYTVSVPAQFNTQLKTSGGSISVRDVRGEVKAKTSGGGLKFTQLRGPLEGHTSGGSVQVNDCEGALKVGTSGGGIKVAGGSGLLDGKTSGGSIAVSSFQGSLRVSTSGGGINLEKIAGKIEGSTSGGSISASLAAPLSDEMKLQTSGGSVTLAIPADSAFNLDAATSGGVVSSDLPVSITGKPARNQIKGPVNGGGKTVTLRTSGGSIRVKKS